MSAVPADQHVDQVESHDETAPAGTAVVVRRHAGVAALVGAAASAVAIAYLWRASQTMSVLDWGLCAVMAAIATVYLATLVDSRVPLLVADDLGVRIRLGAEWRGLPWEAVERVVVRPRRGLFREGRIVFAPHGLARALDGLDAKGRRHASLNQRLYGAALAVPVGITTRVSTHGERTVVEEILALSNGRAPVIEAPVVAAPTAPEPDSETTPEKTPVPPAAPATQPEPALPTPSIDDEADRPVRRSVLGGIGGIGGIGTIVSRVAKGRRHAPAGRAATPAITPATPAATPGNTRVTVPLRATRPALRAEVTMGNAALELSPDDDDAPDRLPESRELRRPGSVDLVFESTGSGEPARVRPISTLGDPVEPLVIDGFVTEPAYDPVIGPELCAARTRLGLSVDDLAERTRIRPHVIESIEVDDFAPCGGDVYARGHLRTLARVLGKDPGPPLAIFGERYATAPVNARRVFEAELATGMTGSMRSTIAGPNWGLLIGVVISLVLVWGVVRLFAGEPAELVQSPAPVLNGSAGVDNRYPGPPSVAAAEPLPIMLTAAFGDTRIVVRDGNGRIAFSGEMVLGEKKRLQVSPPVRVRAADSGAIEVTVKRQDRGVLGVLGEPGRRTFR